MLTTARNFEALLISHSGATATLSTISASAASLMELSVNKGNRKFFVFGLECSAMLCYNVLTASCYVPLYKFAGRGLRRQSLV